MRLPTWIRVALSGCALGFAFPPFALGAVSFIAFLPLLSVWVDDRMVTRSWWRVVGLAWFSMFCYHGLANWWVSSYQEHTDPYLFWSGIVLWLGHPFFMSVPWWILAAIRKRTSAGVTLAVAPLAIAGWEWAHGVGDLSYPWITTGLDMLTVGPYAQAADLFGVYGLTLGIVTTNVLLFIVARGLAVSKRTRMVAALLLVAVHSAWFMYGASRGSVVVPTTNQTHVALVQPNIDPWDKWDSPQGQVSRHVTLVDSLRRTGEQPDLVLWSETAIPYLIRDPRYSEDWSRLLTWVDSLRISLVTGYADIYLYKPGEAPPSARIAPPDASGSEIRYDVFNAAMAINPAVAALDTSSPFSVLRSPIDVHRKTRLTPFAERLPFADQLTFAKRWFEWGVGISAWGKGREWKPLRTEGGGRRAEGEGLELGMIICIESIYPDVAAELTRNGATVLAVITNDAWYNGTWGPRQHYDIARMRAIENRRPVIRCANSGVTGIIDLYGRSVVELPEMQAGIAVGSVQPSSVRTLYTTIGDIVPAACFVVTLLILILARIPGIVRNMPIRINSTTSL
jgi:apolipoprotein N-acyltransferase